VNDHLIDFQSVFQYLPGCNVLVLPDPPNFTVVAVSNEYVNATNITQEKLVGKGLFKVFPNNPEDPEKKSENAACTSLTLALKERAPQYLPPQRYDILNKDQQYEERYWTASNRPVLNEQGEAVFLIHTIEEVTQTVKAEQRVAQLKNLESFYNLFLQAPVAICIVKGENYIVDLANEDMLQILGRTADMIGKPLMESLPEAKSQGLIKIMDQVWYTGKPYHAPVFPASIVINGMREERYFDLVFKPVFSEASEKKPSGIFCVAHNITKQLQVQQQVAASEAKYRTLFQTMDQGFCIMDIIFDEQKQPVDYRFVEINPVFEQQTGLKGAIGKTALELVPNLEKRWVELYGNVSITGEATRFIEGSGAMGKWFEGYAFRVGEPGDYKVALLFSDISERRKAEETEERERLAVAAAELGTYDVDLQTNELVASERMMDIFDVDTLNDRSRYVSALHPDDIPIRAQAYEIAYQSGSLAYESRVIKKDGSIRWIRVKGRIFFDDHATPVKLLGVVQDITEEKQFADELRKQVEQRTVELLEAQKALVATITYFQNIINQFDSALAALVPIYEEDIIVDFFFKMTNDAYTLYSNLSPAAISGKRVSETFPGYYKTDAFERYVQVYQSGETQNWELHYNVDGLNVFLMITASRMNDEVVVNFTDFTELKNLQLDLMHNIEELQRSNKNLEEFAYAASHDLKEPTRKINVFSERLKDSLGERMTETEKRYFERMELASQRMSTLIDDLLTYSEVSQQSVLEETVNVRDLIDQVLHDLDLEIEQKKATFQVDELFVYTGNRRQLQQVFQNLVSNALKYSKADVPPAIAITCKIIKGVEIDRQLHSADQAKTFYQVAVKDNGIGFEQENADRIFNVFTRLHGMAEYKGTGVGLSIVRKVIENHKGYIWAESEPGRGSTFKILLPVE
jgi:PAS domain S-box-containing protein